MKPVVEVLTASTLPEILRDGRGQNGTVAHNTATVVVVQGPPIDVRASVAAYGAKKLENSRGRILGKVVAPNNTALVDDDAESRLMVLLQLCVPFSVVLVDPLLSGIWKKFLGFLLSLSHRRSGRRRKVCRLNFAIHEAPNVIWGSDARRFKRARILVSTLTESVELDVVAEESHMHHGVQ